jgi:hypothetical protein
LEAATEPQSFDLAEAFDNPPHAARPQVLWMWMGSNISRSGITKDLEALEDAGFGGATIFSISDTVTPWAGPILKGPTPEVIAFTEPWWALIHYAVKEARRLGLEIVIHNCAGYESSGGPWIPAELAMQEVIASETKVNSEFSGRLPRARVDLHPHAQFPDVYVPQVGHVDRPVVMARETYYRDIAVLALPSTGTARADQVINLTPEVSSNGDLKWNPPPGDWTIYRVGHTTTGAMIQPAAWEGMGLECDKMNADAVAFHVNHVLTDMRKHLGDLMGRDKTMTTLYFDSYEAGDPNWTPAMPQEFQTRRGYDLIPWLPVLLGRVVESDAATKRFEGHFKQTVHDLYLEHYWGTASRLAQEAGLKFSAEPYAGPWDTRAAAGLLDVPAGEFWTKDGKYFPQSVDDVVAGARRSGKTLIVAESFTGDPKQSHWNETPAWLKPIGDGAFCAGINRFSLHQFAQQPWDDRYQPGNTMGQWGTHFGRHQTWWEGGKAWVRYLARCQALLQAGQPVAEAAEATDVSGPVEMRSIHRRQGESDFFFVANLAREGGSARWVFPVHAAHPQLWDPVWGSKRALPDFKRLASGIEIVLDFAPAQSYFVVFSKGWARSAGSNFLALSPSRSVTGPWEVSFDPRWGGPARVNWRELRDWSQDENPGVKYYSGKVLYKKNLRVEAAAGRELWLDLGTVHHIARVRLNGKELGTVWTAPWRINITRALQAGDNQLEIEVANVWANRLIGDEQEPADCAWTEGHMHSGQFLREFPDWFLRDEPRPSKGRYTFTTWNYFTKDSALTASGLIGPVQLLWA